MSPQKAGKVTASQSVQPETCSLCFFCSVRVPLLFLQTVVGDVVRTLKVMHGSLDRFVPPSVPLPPSCFHCLQVKETLFPSPPQCLLHSRQRSPAGPLLLPVLPAAHTAVLPERRRLRSTHRCLRESVPGRTAGGPLAPTAYGDQGEC